MGTRIMRVYWPCAVIIEAIAVLAFLGCGAPRVQAPPCDIQEEIRRLTAELKNEDICYYAAIELGNLVMKWQHPTDTVEAMKTAALDHTVSFHLTNYYYVGDGLTWYEKGDGARIAFLKWKLREMTYDSERIELVWATYCVPRRCDAISDFCIDELVAMKNDQVVPYLFTVAVAGNWYLRRGAAIRLGDYWPICKPMLKLLTKSDRKDIAEIARRNLLREGKPLPLDTDVGDLSGDIPTWTPPGRGWVIRDEASVQP